VVQKEKTHVATFSAEMNIFIKTAMWSSCLSTHHQTWYGVGSIHGRVVPQNWKTALAACSASCSMLKGGFKGTVHVGCCHWLATNAATVKAAGWPAAQASGDRRRRPLLAFRKRIQRASIMKLNWTSVSHTS